MTTEQILWALDSRAVHVRQYLGRRVYELWADGKFQSWWTSPIEVESAVRKLLGITNEQGVAVEAELERRLSIS